jgi:hypothetical protein
MYFVHFLHRVISLKSRGRNLDLTLPEVSKGLGVANNLFLEKIVRFRRAIGCNYAYASQGSMVLLPSCDTSGTTQAFLSV